MRRTKAKTSSTRIFLLIATIVLWAVSLYLIVFTYQVFNSYRPGDPTEQGHPLVVGGLLVFITLFTLALSFLVSETLVKHNGSKTK